MYIKSKSTKKVRNRNWSYGGTDILQAIEQGNYGGSDKEFYKKHLHPQKKLHLLRVKFPNNLFYKSLASQGKNFCFSAKQLNCIERDYDRNFSEKEKMFHLSVAGHRKYRTV